MWGSSPPCLSATQTLHPGDLSPGVTKLWLLSLHIPRPGRISTCHSPPLWFRHTADQGWQNPVALNKGILTKTAKVALTGIPKDLWLYIFCNFIARHSLYEESKSQVNIKETSKPMSNFQTLANFLTNIQQAVGPQTLIGTVILTTVSRF